MKRFLVKLEAQKFRQNIVRFACLQKFDVKFGLTQFLVNVDAPKNQFSGLYTMVSGYDIE